jgi:V/A-type H+-transporting ATPase subunit E
MKTLKEGNEKIQEICNLLKKETLEPAKKEAEHLIELAKIRAEEILREAEHQKESLIEETKMSLKKERAVFETALFQAASQAKEALKQEIEEKFFSHELKSLITQEMSSQQIVSSLLEALIKALEKEGVAAKITAIIPQTVEKDAVNRKLIQTTLEKLKGKSVTVGSFKGGVQIKVEGSQLTIDLTDEAVSEMLIPYLRADFRKKMFGEG